MNEDAILVKTAITLIETNDLSISSWQGIIERASSGNLLNLLTAGRTAIEYGTKTKILKGLPKKSWQHAVEKAKTNTESKKAAEEFIKKVEETLKEKKITIA